MVAMKYASNIVYASYLFGVLQITFQLKTWVIFSFKCLDEFDLSRNTLCSLHLISTFLTVSPQLYIPS